MQKYIQQDYFNQKYNGITSQIILLDNIYTIPLLSNT